MKVVVGQGEVLKGVVGQGKAVMKKEWIWIYVGRDCDVKGGGWKGV